MFRREVIGGSSSTAAIANLAINLPSDMPAGAIFFSPDRPNLSQVASIRRPALVIFHALDTDAIRTAFFNAL